MHKNIKTYMSVLALLFVCAFAQECVEKKRKKKEPLQKLQQRVVEGSKRLILEASSLGGKLAQIVESAVLVLDEEETGILAGEDREKLKIYSTNLEEIEGAIKKCKNDIELLQVKNSNILK